MKRISKLAASILAVVLLIGLDQVTKKLAQAYLLGKKAISVIGDFFVFLYATNRGGFLSFGSGVGDWLWWLFFVILPVLVLAVLSVYIILRKKEDGYYLSFWVFVISGGVGNLIDRILYGEVIDFMHINFGFFKTGVFNVADLYLNVFALLVVLLYFISNKKDSTDCPVEQQENGK